MTDRVSCTLDLAAMTRSRTGNDITPQSCGVSSRVTTGDTDHVFSKIQAVAAVAEKWNKVAEMAAESPPAQMGLSCGQACLPPFSVVALT